MGMLFTGQHTAKICARLNRRFSDDNLDAIRGSRRKRAKFLDPINNKRTLARIAFKSGTYPSDSPTSRVAKRWFFFLDKVVTSTIALEIRQALLKGITEERDEDYRYNALVFVAIEGQGMRFSTEDIEVLDPQGNPTGKAVLLFKLQTQRIPTNVAYDPSETSDPDEDETTEPNEDPPDPEPVPAPAVTSGAGTKIAKEKAAKKRAAKEKTAKKKLAKKKI